MKKFISVMLLFLVSVIISCSNTSAVSDCEAECLGKSRQAIAKCGDDQKCKMDVKASYDKCVAACRK